MGETADLTRIHTETYPSAGFEESAVETSPEIEATKAEIEHTRSEMSATIDAIKAQLSPKHLVEEAKEAVTQAVQEKVEEAKDAVKDKVSEITHGASDVVMNAMGAVGGAVSSLVDGAQEMFSGHKHDAGVSTSAPVSGAQVNGQAITVAGVTAGVVAAAGVSGDKAKELGELVMATVKENPIPAALVGLGLGWLLIDAVMKQQRGANPAPYSGGVVARTDSYGDSGYGTARGVSYGAVTTNTNSGGYNTGYAPYPPVASNPIQATGTQISDAVSDATQKLGSAAQDLQAKAASTVGDLQHKAGDIAHTVQDKAGDIASTVQQKAGELATTAQQKATELTTATQQTAQQAASATQDFVTDNPLAAGAIALVVGVIVGLALPNTDQENALMGGYRDQLADQAGQQAQDLLGKVQTVAGRAMDTAKTQLSEVKDNVISQLGDAKDKIQSSVQTSAQTSGLVHTDALVPVAA